MIRMANETEKDLNIGIRNYIRELNSDEPDFMSTIGTRDPKDLHSNAKQQIGTDENGEPIYADKLIALIEKYNLMQYD